MRAYAQSNSAESVGWISKRVIFNLSWIRALVQCADHRSRRTDSDCIGTVNQYRRSLQEKRQAHVAYWTAPRTHGHHWVSLVEHHGRPAARPGASFADCPRWCTRIHSGEGGGQDTHWVVNLLYYKGCPEGLPLKHRFVLKNIRTTRLPLTLCDLPTQGILTLDWRPEKDIKTM